MGIISIVLAAFVTFVVILLIAGLVIKKEYTIEREIIIDKELPRIFEFIKYIKNQESYNKWWMRDPDAKKTYSGIDGSVGFIAAWDSADKHAGKGEQEITAIIEGNRVDHEIRFERPFKGITYSYLAVEAVSGKQTRVKWVFYGINKFPMNLMSKLLNLNKMLGDELQMSLQNLKTILEK